MIKVKLHRIIRWKAMSRLDIEKLESELQGLTIKEINDHPTKSREEIAFDLFVLASEK